MWGGNGNVIIGWDLEKEGGCEIRCGGDCGGGWLMRFASG